MTCATSSAAIGRHRARERHDGDRDGIGDARVMVRRSCANAGVAARGRQQRRAEDEWLVFSCVHSLGANVSSKLRSNGAGSGGGWQRRSAIYRGLDRFTQRGIVDAATVHADGRDLAARNLGDRHNTRDARPCRGWFDPGPRRCARRSAHASASASSLLRAALPRSSASRARRSSASRASRAFSSAAFFAAAASSARFFSGAFLSATAFSAAAFSAAAFAAACFSASTLLGVFALLQFLRGLLFLLRASSAVRAARCFLFLALDLGRIGFRRPLLFRRAAAPVRARAPARFGGGGSGAGSASGAMPFSARSSTTVASMASVSTGGGRCFHVNQPYTAAATMAECSRIDSAIARHRPFVSDLPERGGIVGQRARFCSGRLRDEADFARAGALQDGHCANDFPIGHAVVATHQHGGFGRAAQNRRCLRFDCRGVRGSFSGLL